ncbi:MAG: excinuclease ABC subunit UvrC [Bacillota bacterium]
MDLDQLIDKVSRFPASPGVYLIKDAVDRVLYVGKARSLRQRVRSYLTETGTISPKTKAMQTQMKDIDFIVTDSEVEALILECNLIKEHSPRYNVNLRDDKDYPYLRLTADSYPRLEYLRLSQKEGRRKGKAAGGGKPGGQQSSSGRFFGPYTNAGAVRHTMQFLGKIFPLRRCSQPLNGEPVGRRPCLNYQMKRCLAPCRGAATVTPQEYGSLVKQVTLFLEGHQAELRRYLEKQMRDSAAEHRYEAAARFRDQLQALRQVAAQQQNVLDIKHTRSQDVLALVRLEKEAAVHLFKIREGKLLSQDHFRLTGTGDVPDPEVLAAFIKQYYMRAGRPPAELLLSHLPPEAALLQEWLNRLADRRVSLAVPRRGSRKQLVELTQRNGLLKLQEDEQRTWQREQLPLKELAVLVGLPGEPARIEGYDISHLRGDQAIGSLVVFDQGCPEKDSYRHFHIRQAPAGDDYAALQEVLRRRAGRSDWPRPDLIFIDGGKGQLNAAREALNGTGLAGVSLLSLAKDPEQIFVEGSAAPLVLPANSTLLQLLQRIRDEAHRFALEAHRRLRRRSNVRSALEDVPGIGPKRRIALLEHFGCIEALLRATEEEIKAAPGIDQATASRLYRHLHH